MRISGKVTSLTSLISSGSGRRGRGQHVNKASVLPLTRDVAIASDRRVGNRSHDNRRLGAAPPVRFQFTGVICGGVYALTYADWMHSIPGLKWNVSGEEHLSAFQPFLSAMC